MNPCYTSLSAVNYLFVAIKVSPIVSVAKATLPHASTFSLTSIYFPLRKVA